MKKIIASFFVFISLLILSSQIAMASFMMHDNLHLNKHETQKSSCSSGMESTEEDKSDHSCCVSPFKESGISFASTTIKSEKDFKKLKTFESYDFFDLGSFSYSNNLDKLNSPPKFLNLENQDNLYTLLIGIVKNNC